MLKDSVKKVAYPFLYHLATSQLTDHLSPLRIDIKKGLFKQQI